MPRGRQPSHTPLMVTMVGHAETPQGRGMVVAANSLAAKAGADVLAAGGNAADGAVAAAAALSVVDPANCGVGGYGGFAVVHWPGSEPSQIAFNAVVPGSARASTDDARSGPGGKVTPPSVIAGLCALQSRFGRLERSALWVPAAALARDGFRVGRSLADAIRWARTNHRGLNDAFRRTFLPDGEPLTEGALLRQPRLAQALEHVASEGIEAIRGGALVSDICHATNQAGGNLSADDFRALDAPITAAAHRTYEGADVWTSDPEQSGGSILLSALAVLDDVALGADRQARYVDAVAAALAGAWRVRDASFLPLSRAVSQTSHLCVGDAEGMVVSMTFTHGPIWFGSGLATEESGIVLNCGRHLLARRVRDGAIVAQPHLTPTIVHRGATRYALGSPGGRRIPAIVLQVVVDLVHYRAPVERVLEAPRLSTNADGSLEAEHALADRFPDRAVKRIEAHEYFGPASVLAWSAESIQGAADPRFADASVATA